MDTRLQIYGNERSLKMTKFQLNILLHARRKKFLQHEVLIEGKLLELFKHEISFLILWSAEFCRAQQNHQQKRRLSNFQNNFPIKCFQFYGSPTTRKAFLHN